MFGGGGLHDHPWVSFSTFYSFTSRTWRHLICCMLLLAPHGMILEPTLCKTYTGKLLDRASPEHVQRPCQVRTKISGASRFSWFAYGQAREEIEDCLYALQTRIPKKELWLQKAQRMLST